MGTGLAVPRPDRGTFAAFALMTILGAVNAIGVRVTVREMEPFWGATLRFLLAALILAAVAVLRRSSIPRGRALVGVVLFGLVNFGLSYMFLYWALREVAAGTAMVIGSIVPLLTLLLAVLQGVERFRRLGLVGALVAGLGIVVVFADQASFAVPLAALLALLAGALCIAQSGVIVKRLPLGDPVVANALAMSIGAALLASLSVATGERWALPARVETWLAVGYLVAFGSVAVFMLALYVLVRWTASATSYAFLLMPMLTIVLGFLLLNEPFRPAFLLGGLLVLVGVYVGAVYRPRVAPPVAVAPALPSTAVRVASPVAPIPAAAGASAHVAQWFPPNCPP